MAAEVLGVPLEDIIIYSSDTDMTPFDVGAYASSTTYVSGMAVKKAAEEAAKKALNDIRTNLIYTFPNFFSFISFFHFIFYRSFS